MIPFLNRAQQCTMSTLMGLISRVTYFLSVLVAMGYSIKDTTGASQMRMHKGLRQWSIYAAGHLDAFSGNTINLYHIKEHGWVFIGMVAYLCYVCSHLHLLGNYDVTKLRSLRHLFWEYHQLISCQGTNPALPLSTWHQSHLA